jgi:hypothetical protein
MALALNYLSAAKKGFVACRKLRTDFKGLPFSKAIKSNFKTSVSFFLFSVAKMSCTSYKRDPGIKANKSIGNCAASS